MKRITFYLLACLWVVTSAAQSVDTPLEDALKSSSCPFDNEASAYVISSDFDICMRARGQQDFLCITQTKRIKILKENGLDAANVEFLINDDESASGFHDELVDLKAVAYNLEDGKTVSTKLTKETISKQRLNSKLVAVRFVIPNVKVGSVINYSYQIYREAIFDVPEWLAQDYYPVGYAHCSIQLPGYVGYYYEQTGCHRIDMQKKEVDNNSLHTKDMLFDFTCQSLPALPKNTDFTYCPMDYADKIIFEVSEIYHRGIRRSFARKQEDVNRILFDSSVFGGRLKQKNPLKDEMAALGIAAIPDVMERAKATILLLKSKLRWNGKYNLVGTSLSKVLKEGSGDNADLNFVLMSMLKDAGVDCYPVVMSRRSRGALPVNRPSIDALNTFVVAIAENPTTMHYYDCSAENGCIDVLPAELNVSRAFLLYSSRKYEEVNLQSVVNQRSNVTLALELSADGTLKGTRRNTFSGLAALKFRNMWSEKNDSTAFVADIEDANNISIEHFNTKGMTDFSPTVSYDYGFTSQQDGSNGYYIKPFAMPVFDANPFTAEESSLPVEFPSVGSYVMSVDIKLPEGYHLAEPYEPVSLAFPENAMTCKIILQETNSRVQGNCRMNINKVYFGVEDYPLLREFFDVLEKACSKMIVITKD